jgi:hypothetical protein
MDNVAEGVAPTQPDGAAERSPRTRVLVTYTRRYARNHGERIPVYVSPDYHGPARG